jgi:GNAT superfamily N-acetyltransferase
MDGWYSSKRSSAPPAKNLFDLEIFQNGYCISTDKSRIDIAAVHEYLSNHSYWSAGIPFETVKRSIEHSLCFGIYKDERQVGFARVITDQATYAYLADVFVVSSERGKGLSKWLMTAILGYPALQGLRRFVLATRDAHGLYEQFGFTVYKDPERLMSRHDPDVYKKMGR